jgi:hypothetical protein
MRNKHNRLQFTEKTYLNLSFRLKQVADHILLCNRENAASKVEIGDLGPSGSGQQPAAEGASSPELGDEETKEITGDQSNNAPN